MRQGHKMMGLAAAACTLLGMGAANAAVTLTFAQVGLNVTATWSGTYNLPSGSFVPIFPGAFVTTGTAYGISSGTSLRTGGGSSFPSGLIPTAGSYTGTTFGFSAGTLYFPIGASGTFMPTGTITFTNKTLAALGASSFNNTLAYTGAGNVGGNREIRFQTQSISAVPEPASVLGTAGVLASGLMIRRRKLGRVRG